MISSVHHVGCLVRSIDHAIADYLKLHPAALVSGVYDITDQLVKVCFFTIGDFNIEFVEPYGAESYLYKMLEKNPGFYHIGIYTDDIEEELVRLQKEGYYKINQFRSPAFNNSYCAFLLNRERHMIELIEERKY